MKRFAVALLGLLALIGCQEEAFWAGSVTAVEPIAIIGTDGKISMEIAKGSKVKAALYQEPDRTWLFEIRDFETSVAIRIPNPPSTFQYGRVYHFKNFGQNFDVSVRATRYQASAGTGRRYEYCSEMKYVCSWGWESGEYKHTCQHKPTQGTRTIEYQNLREEEVIDGEFIGSGDKVIADFELVRDLGFSEKILRRGACQPTTP